jgi:formate dehydrogenase major subunit
MTTFLLDGKEVEAQDGESILQVALREGKELPHLCYKVGLGAVGNCRSCMVEVEGERVLAASCCRNAEAGMVIHTDSERAENARKAVLELLVSDCSDERYTADSELEHWAKKVGAELNRYPASNKPDSDCSHPAITVNLDACIQCTRCLRACRDVQVNDVIGLAGRGAESKIVFDLDDPMGDSSCVACGECVQACPTGALMPSGNLGLIKTDRKVETTCPYCGVGCLLTLHITDNKIIHVEGRDGETNHSRLCVKGRFGFDYIHHPKRLTKPLIRREGVAKNGGQLIGYEQIDEVFREASWEEALDLAATGLKQIKENSGSSALAGFGSAKGSNEEAYLFQKLVRVGFGSNNVDHCTRLCHASSVAALLETIGSGAVSNPFEDTTKADVIVVIGSQTDSNHPVAATFIKNAVKQGSKLVYINPYRPVLARHATYCLQIHPDSDVALLNAIMSVIVEEGLVNQTFIEERTEGFSELKEELTDYSPESVEGICGIEAETIRQVARLYATAEHSIIFWGMGISQHIHGTDNVRCLISLALMTGQIGREGTGLHPLRGQNNVQGASDMGLIPMGYPNYRSPSDKSAQEWFEGFWQAPLSSDPGLTVVEIIDAIHANEIKGMYIMGENPAMSDPDLNHSRAALAKLGHLVVQDIFFTETAGFADVILPASAFPEKTGTFTNTDRRVQLGRQAINPPGEARQDLEIIQEIARRIGLDWDYDGPEVVNDEIRMAVPPMAGISWARLNSEDSITYPCPDLKSAGEPVLFKEQFPTANGRGKFVPAHFIHADELPDQDYAFVLITGRQLEHWHTGAITRHAKILDAIEPDPVVSIHPETLTELGAEAGEKLKIKSRRGEIVAFARADNGMQKKVVFMPFCHVEAAANLLTNPKLDPFGKIPEFKFCAVKVSPAE